MYSECNFIEIDIFKDNGLYRSLTNHNGDIEMVAKMARYDKGGNYDLNNKEAAFWFNPNDIRNTPLPSIYPEIHPVQHDNRLCLTTHCVNHVVMLMLDILYRDNKSILVEDICCGMGNLIYYLSKLGFNRFNGIDNFSQLPQWMFEELMKRGNISYELNNMKADAVVSSIIAYPHYVKIVDTKAYMPDSLELFMSYVPLLPGTRHLSPLDNDKFFETFTPLAKDPYRMLWSYCKEHKYKEFSQKLQQIKL